MSPPRPDQAHQLALVDFVGSTATATATGSRAVHCPTNINADGLCYDAVVGWLLSQDIS
jgi:hypothetical protein